MPHYLTSIIDFIRRHRLMVMITVLACVLANLLALLLPIYIAQSFRFLFEVQSVRAQFLSFLPQAVRQSFEAYLWGFAVLLVLRTGLDFAQRSLIARLGERHLAELRQQLFDRQLRARARVYDQKGIGKYLLRYSGDLSSIQGLLTKGCIRFGSDLLLLFGLLGILYSWAPLLALGVGGSLLLLWAWIALLNRQLYIASLQRRNAKAGLLRFVSLRLRSLPTIRLLNRHVPETNRFNRRVETLYRLGLRYQFYRNAIGASIPGGLYAVLGALIASIPLLQANVLRNWSADQFFAATLLLLTALPVLRRCFRVSMVWKNGSISYRKLMKVLSLPVEPSGPDRFPKSEAYPICVRNLRFRYDEQQPLIKDWSAHFPARAISVVHGNNGSGKSTLVQLLCRTYEPQSGTIELAGQNISAYSPKAVRRCVAAATDGCPLLGKTVFEAISYSRCENKRPAAREILHRLGADHFLSLDTPIGELGCRLSRGQHQLLRLARALLTEKPVLLLDEPFTALSPYRQQLLIEVLHRRRTQQTIVLFCSAPPPAPLDADHHYDLSHSVIVNPDL